jgi:single-strand DNA-binding protein
MSSFSSFNKVMLLGALGKDVEMKYSQGGTAIANFSFATSHSVKKGDAYEDATDWHRIVVFGAQAENCSKFLKKGSKAFVEGRLQTREYDDRDGNKKYITEVVASAVKFMDAKEKGGNSSYSSPKPAPKDDGLEVEGVDDLPF